MPILLDDVVAAARQAATIFGTWTKTEMAAGVGALVAAVSGVVKTTGWFQERRRKKRTGSLEERALRGLARQSFGEEMLARATKNYIEQGCSNLDPTKEQRLRNAVSVQEPVFKVVNRELSSGAIRHILVLADSGMGKTTLLLNLLAADLDLSVEKRRGLVIVSLAHDDALARIEQIHGKSDKVLLLDAFDEDVEAIADHRRRLATLMRASRDFSAVILTCRTQFFSADEEIPREAGVLRIEPRPAGQDQALVFRKLYLLPYSDEQVLRYLKKVIPWWQRDHRRKAIALTKRLDDLAARPMLLSVVPELVRTGHDIREIFQLYDFMVETWFHRERTWVDRDTLRTASKLLAADMVLRRQERGDECVASYELKGVLRTLTHPVANWKLEARSLLNRDNAGRLKFSHRSIMEYFFVVAAIEGERQTMTVPWTNQMREFLFSWGRLKGTKTVETVESIFRMDLRPTGIFPVKCASENRDVNAEELARLIALPVPAAISSGFPEHWRAYSLKVLTENTSWHVRELADGITWVVPRVPARRNVVQASYFNFDTGAQSTSKDQKPWLVQYSSKDYSVDGADASEDAPVTLAEFMTLFSLLAHSKRTQDLIDPSECYWVRGEHGKIRYLVNARRASDSENELNQRVGMERLCALRHSVGGEDRVISLFRTSSANARAVKIRAQRTVASVFLN